MTRTKTVLRGLIAASLAAGLALALLDTPSLKGVAPVYPGEGEAVIFKPDTRGGFALIGRLTPEDWVLLAGTARQ